MFLDNIFSVIQIVSITNIFQLTCRTITVHIIIDISNFSLRIRCYKTNSVVVAIDFPVEY